MSGANNGVAGAVSGSRRNASFSAVLPAIIGSIFLPFVSFCELQGYVVVFYGRACAGKGLCK